MIPVTKSYLPDKEKFISYVDQIYERGWLTNNGQLVRELENKLKDYLGVKHLILVANGSLALQVAYKALGLKNEVITTPFSFVATTSTLAWEGLTPIFSDINPETFNIDPAEIEQKITDKTLIKGTVLELRNRSQEQRINSARGARRPRPSPRVTFSPRRREAHLAR